MIEPTKNDIGRMVTYQTSWTSTGDDGIDVCHVRVEDGIITSFNDTCVFVRYGADKHSKGTRRIDLEWAVW